MRENQTRWMTNVERRVSKVLAGQNESTQVSDIGEVEDDSRRRFRNNKKGFGGV